MGKYILEGDSEGERLERQNAGRLYDISEELKEITFKSEETILDVGCGTGALTRQILQKKSDVKITAVDFSEIRLKQAKLYLGSDFSSQVEFKFADILNRSEIGGEEYDTVVSRFVLHHLVDAQLAVKNMAQAIKYGGRLIVVDSDGIMFNFYCDDEFVMSALDKLKQNFESDFMVGRKLRTYFLNSGLKDIEVSMIPMHFVGDALRLEVSQYQERFALMMPLIESILGGDDARRFTSGYIKALSEGRAELFYNKFVCVGHKTNGKINKPQWNGSVIS